MCRDKSRTATKHTFISSVCVCFVFGFIGIVSFNSQSSNQPASHFKNSCYQHHQTIYSIDYSDVWEWERSGFTLILNSLQDNKSKKENNNKTLKKEFLCLSGYYCCECCRVPRPSCAQVRFLKAHATVRVKFLLLPKTFSSEPEFENVCFCNSSNNNTK